MIYILLGGDTKNKNLYTKELMGKNEVFFVPSNIFDKNIILGYSADSNLFGKNPTIILDNILSEGNINFSDEDMLSLKESGTDFVFREEKMNASDQKRYKKFADIKTFDLKTIANNLKFNVFSITDAFARKDKINTWVLYLEAISKGVEPEAISGVLFWKIKSLILNGSSVFNPNELRVYSSDIVSLYHRAHRGEVDFTISLEQFILSALSSK